MSSSPASEMDVEVVQKDIHSSPLSEHNYSKSSEEAPAHEEGEEEKMDTGGCPSLTSLDENQDTFETFLLCLLHAFTRNQREEEAGSRVELNVSLGSGFLEISPSALSSLSPEQVQTLLTSNSVNYDAVQQIMAQKQHHHQQRGRNDPQGEPQEPTSSSSSDMAAQNGSPVLQQVLGMQFTQEQLKQIQIQVNELLRSQHVSLPPDLTPEQQQQLIQTLIWKQIHMQGPLQTQGNGGQKSTIVSLLKREETDTVTPTPSQAPSQAPPVTESASLQKSVQMQVSTSQQMDSPQQPLQSTAVLGASLTPAPAVLNPVIVPSTAFRSSLTKPSPAPLPKSTPPPLTSPTAITPTLTSPSQSPAPSISSPVTIIPSGPTVVTRRRKDTTKTKKEEPKKPPLPYNLFFSEVYSTVHAANPQMSFADSSRIISMMWNAMGRDTKQRYYNEHERLKEEYGIAMEKYKEETRPAVELTTVARAEKAEDEVQIETELNNPEPISEAAEKQNAASTPVDTSVPVKPEPKDPNLCVNEGCVNAAVFAEERGPGYCSNDCVAKHCRNVFQAWVAERKAKA